MLTTIIDIVGITDISRQLGVVAETHADEVGKSDDGVERGAQLVAQAGEESRLAGARLLRLLPRGFEARLDLLAIDDVGIDAERALDELLVAPLERPADIALRSVADDHREAGIGIEGPQDVGQPKDPGELVGQGLEPGL